MNLMKKKIVCSIIMVFLSFTMIFSDERPFNHFLGTTLQINGGIDFSHSTPTLNQLNVTLGINYEIFIRKYFSVENIFNLGYTAFNYSTFNYTEKHQGFNFSHYTYLSLNAGSDLVQFLFSPFGIKFSFIVSYPFRNDIYTNDYNITITPGFSSRFGITVLTGTNKNILITPGYFNIDLNPAIYIDSKTVNFLLNLGGGTSIKFRL